MDSQWELHTFKGKVQVPEAGPQIISENIESVEARSRSPCILIVITRMAGNQPTILTDLGLSMSS